MAVENITYFWAALAGLISFLSPCVLPLVPAYLCYMTGTTLDRLQEAEGDGSAEGRALLARVLPASVAFVLGFTLVFVALGASASYISRFLLAWSYELSMVAGAVIVVFGLAMMGVFRIGVLQREARFSPDTTSAMGLFGPFLLGLAFAFGWTPCIGPILGTILVIAGSQDSLAYGASLLAVYSLGLGIPFVLAGLGVSRFLAFARRIRPWMRWIEIGAGALLVVTGVMIFMGTLQDLSFWLLETFPALSTLG
ncbi:MAG: cytochrome c biogenesis protein CcdA [Alphaproteobacteria bacterium]|nr:cytochrome c biogenesis protein CcdA [Alphaproteobacteria bacterium]MDX5368921.1 cytochrome c biogenesis protein CcdA [Alphaproteobacteria bacterium]MDX5463645.1 cytochrome c biogenesis protein CcdA [Alphaproteobacteria bacterium]